MNIDFKEEILENEFVSICGTESFIKQLLFDVTGEVEGFELSSNVSIYSKYLMLTRVDNMLFIEDVQYEDEDFIKQDTEILWIDEEVLDEAYRKCQQGAFLEWKDIVHIY